MPDDSTNKDHRWPWINGGNPEHKCPETGEPAWCYHKACETQTCDDAKRYEFEFRYALGRLSGQE